MLATGKTTKYNIFGIVESRNNSIYDAVKNDKLLMTSSQTFYQAVKFSLMRVLLRAKLRKWNKLDKRRIIFNISTTVFHKEVGKRSTRIATIWENCSWLQLGLIFADIY